MDIYSNPAVGDVALGLVPRCMHCVNERYELYVRSFENRLSNIRGFGRQCSNYERYFRFLNETKIWYGSLDCHLYDTAGYRIFPVNFQLNRPGFLMRKRDNVLI